MIESIDKLNDRWTKALQGKLRKPRSGETISAGKEEVATRFLSETRHIKRISVLLLVLTSLVVSLSPSLGMSEKLLWDGKYQQENGAQDLYLQQVDTLLSVDIVKAGESKDNLAEGAHFIARIKGNVATFDDHEGCKTQLIRRHDGVEIKDQCSGTQRDSGRYKKAS